MAPSNPRQKKELNINARNDDGLTALVLASVNGHPGTVEKLIKAGAKIDFRTTDLSMTALMYAVGANKPDVVKVLLKNGADVNAVSSYKQTPLMWAAAVGSKDLAKILLDAGADPSITMIGEMSGATALSIAQDFQYKDVIELLKKTGAQAGKSYYDSTVMIPEEAQALIKAAGKGDMKKVQTLLKNRIDLSADNDTGVTALIAASYAGHVDIVEMLLTKGADPNQKDDVFSRSPLMYAAGAKRSAVVKSLLKRGAYVNETADYNQTPLMFAIYEGATDIVQLLLDAGADVTIKMTGKFDGITALMIAREKNRGDIIRLLEQAGAKE